MGGLSKPNKTCKNKFLCSNKLKEG